MPLALFTLPPRLRTPVEESQAGAGSFGGRGWAGPVATAGQVRGRLWADSHVRRHPCPQVWLSAETASGGEIAH
jgi:hypothetical protein